MILSSAHQWLRLRKFFHTTLRCPTGIQSFSGKLTEKWILNVLKAYNMVIG